MTTMQLGPVSVEPLEGITAFRGAPLGDREAGLREGSVQLAKVTTPDGLIATIGVTQWPDGSYDQRLIDYLAGPDAYRRLERAGGRASRATSASRLARARAW